MWDERIGRGRPWSVRPSVGWSRSSGHAIHSIQYVWLVFGLEIAESFSMGPVRRRPRRAHAAASSERTNGLTDCYIAEWVRPRPLNTALLHCSIWHCLAINWSSFVIFQIPMAIQGTELRLLQPWGSRPWPTWIAHPFYWPLVGLQPKYGRFVVIPYLWRC